jgi:ribosomal protein S18 acetylase RimI-like enzyme
MPSPEQRENLNIEISPFMPEDERGRLNVQHQASLATYPNAELGITKDDIEEWFKDSLTDESIRKEEERIKDLPPNPDQQFLVAKSEGKVVGFCVVDKYTDKNQLNGIYILPEFQGKGLGKELWSRSMEFVDRTKPTVVMVIPYNKQAIGAYERFGFQKTGKKANDSEGAKLKSGAILPTPIEMVLKASEEKQDDTAASTVSVNERVLGQEQADQKKREALHQELGIRDKTSL